MSRELAMKVLIFALCAAIALACEHALAAPGQPGGPLATVRIMCKCRYGRKRRPMRSPMRAGNASCTSDLVAGTAV